MKIHIVQKGDTLWKLAEKYGVDFEQLKAANAQLSNPDMIMPGMKIKVPTGSVPVKKEAQVKEQPVQIAPQHVKEQPKKEVQVAPQVKEEPKMEMPQMPHMEMPVQQIMQPTKKKIDVNTYHTNVNFYQPQKQEKPKPKMPTVQKPPVSKKVEPKKEMMKPKKEVKPIKKETYEPKHYAPKQPMKKPQPPMPQMKPMQQPMPQMKPQMQQPMPQMKPQMQQPMPSLKPQMQQPMCPPEQLQPVTPLMPGCGPTQPFFGSPMQPDAYQPPMQPQFQGYQEPMPHFPNQQMMPQSFQPDTQMPFYPQPQQPMPQQPYQPQQMAFSPSNQMPMQQAMPHQPQSNYPMPSNDCCGPTHPVTYGPNGQMMPAQDAYFMQGYHETDDYDD